MQFRVINSGALNHDPLEVVHGWIGLLNSGNQMTPVGCSDSHSVSFSIAGQGRTYIKGDDSDVSSIDESEVVGNFLAGRVTVSMGLFAEIEVNGSTGAGEVTKSLDANEVAVTVKSPNWSLPNRFLLFANGVQVGDQVFKAERKAEGGYRFYYTWKLPRPKQDTNYVVVALGDGIREAFLAEQETLSAGVDRLFPLRYCSDWCSLGRC